MGKCFNFGRIFRHRDIIKRRCWLILAVGAKVKINSGPTSGKVLGPVDIAEDSAHRLCEVSVDVLEYWDRP